MFLVYLQSQRVYEDTIRKSREDIVRLTQLVADNSDLSLHSVDLMLRRASERQYFNLLFGGTLKADIRLNLELWADEISHVEFMMVVDEKGDITIANSPRHVLGFSQGRAFPDEKHFMSHRDNEDQGLLISVYSDPRLENNAGYFLMSRRLEKLDGSFGGLVVALVDGRSLTDYIKSIEAGQHADVTLMLEDVGMFIGSDLVQKEDALSKWIEQRRISENLAGNGQKTVDVASIELNDEDAFVAMKRLSRFPLSVALVMYEDNILSSYYTNRYYYFIFLGVFIGFTVTIGFFTVALVGQVQRVQYSEQKALLASQTKSDFLAKISHELRTPLNAIIGFSEMLQAEYFGKLQEDQQDRVKDINDCATHLLALINDLLDFSKAEAGKLVLQEENIYLGDVTSEALRMMRANAEQAKVELVDKTVQCLPTLTADRRKLKQVIVNLLSNAIKFTPKGGKVILSTMMTKKGDLQVMVEDTGIGMRAEHIPIAFAMFEQVHNDHSQKGTGLGLSLCKMLVELHGGRIGIKSEEGKGTAVFFHLPKKLITDPTFTKTKLF